MLHVLSPVAAPTNCAKIWHVSSEEKSAPLKKDYHKVPMLPELVRVWKISPVRALEKLFYDKSSSTRQF